MKNFVVCFSPAFLFAWIKYRTYANISSQVDIRVALALKLTAMRRSRMLVSNSAFSVDFTALFQALTGRIAVIFDRPHILAIAWRALAANELEAKQLDSFCTNNSCRIVCSWGKANVPWPFIACSLTKFYYMNSMSEVLPAKCSLTIVTFKCCTVSSADFAT